MAFVFLTFFFSNLSSFFIIFPGEGKEENKERWWILPPRQEEKREHLRRETHHLQIAALVNSTTCQGIPGKFNHLVWFFSECHLTSGSALRLQNSTSSAMHAAWSVLHTTILEKQTVVVFWTLWELNNYVNYEKQKKHQQERIERSKKVRIVKLWCFIVYWILSLPPQDFPI